MTKLSPAAPSIDPTELAAGKDVAAAPRIEATISIYELDVNKGWVDIRPAQLLPKREVTAMAAPWYVGNRGY
ncbi:hypothetical protein HO173_007603 [Letharia columbiana]|uniref:Uncharacterized protein n=1 Tax=Letharia columbiana TaxID=112416 RepID=A0A8H6L3H5_9LECA|nr:uncharacterized protein HO173_007603 [Letharia columbiana]KAF6234183.1 hypothetical protein HO173_007603 [Letharia columbiana]